MRYLYVLIIVLFFPLGLIAQQDIDAGFTEARKMSEIKNYSRALTILKELEKKYPENEDIQVFQGRIYSWKKDYNKSKQLLKPLSDRVHPNLEALEAIINTYYWSKDFKDCIAYCDDYLAKNPGDTNILIIKADCLEKTGREDEALAILNSLPSQDNTNEKATALKDLIARKRKNAVSASYLNISTYDPAESPIHYGYVEYLRRFARSALAGRVNMGYRNGEYEGQLELDYYKNFKRSYLYTNAGISNGDLIFPKIRLGAEYYFAPQGRFDLSFGGRFMNFEEDNVYLVTGQASYRMGTYAVGYRPYYDIDNSLLSHVVSIQKSNEEKESLLRLELQYGNVPYLYIYNSFTQPLKAYRAGIQYQARIGNSLLLRPVFLYEYEEFLPDSYRHRFNCQLIVTKRF